MTKRVEPLIYRDVLSIISKHCDSQTWGRLKQSCKLFNMVLLHPPLEFKPLIRRLIYRLDKVVQSFNIWRHLRELRELNLNTHFLLMCYVIYGNGNIYYLFDAPGSIFGNIYTEPVETIIQRYIKYKENNW
jgi:hypothetical protein